MTTSSVPVTPGSGADVATYAITEDAKTKNLQRFVGSDSAGREILTRGVAYTETSGTLTATSVTVAANADRRGLIIGNPSDTVMTMRVGGTASATVGIPIPAGGSIALFGGNCPSALVTVYCAGTSKAYTIYEF